MRRRRSGATTHDLIHHSSNQLGIYGTAATARVLTGHYTDPWILRRRKSGATHDPIHHPSNPIILVLMGQAQLTDSNWSTLYSRDCQLATDGEEIYLEQQHMIQSIIHPIQLSRCLCDTLWV